MVPVDGCSVPGWPLMTVVGCSLVSDVDPWSAAHGAKYLLFSYRYQHVQTIPGGQHPVAIAAVRVDTVSAC